MTVSAYEAVLRRAGERLAAAGVWDATGDLDALADRFLARVDPGAALAEFEAAVDERCARIPLAHITGSVTFDGLYLAVGTGVFAPRVETVPLVHWAARGDVLPTGGRVLDLCAGVGALGLAVARRRPDATVVCVERDDTALRYLYRNAARHAGATGRVEVVIGDLLEPDCLAAFGGVDVVMANPPFVASNVQLLPEWADHHPRDAVYSGADGLDLIRCIVAHATRVLRPGGRLAIEHDRRQPGQVQRLLADAGLTEVSTLDDTAGQQRITVARIPVRETA